jgi:AP-1 complex subunit beta-1
MSFLWRFLPDVVFHSDFDDSTSLEGQPSGLAATQVLSQTPAAANLIAGTSSNPLDDLVSIFGGGGGSMPLSAAPMSAFGGGAFMATAPPTPALGYAPPTPKPNSQPQQPQQDDLLGLF